MNNVVVELQNYISAPLWCVLAHWTFMVVKDERGVPEDKGLSLAMRIL